MALRVDELECNSFFRKLQSKYSIKYEEAQKKLWLICVPHHKSLKGLEITKEFVDAHVLKPSPFFKSHYVATDGNNDTSYEIENGHITTAYDIIKVLSEESAYNEEFKPYKILIIEKPLVYSKRKREIDSYRSRSCSEKLNLSITECINYLKSYPECSKVIELLDKKIYVFNSSYMVLPQYLEDAAAKLKAIFQWSSHEFLKMASSENITCDNLKIKISTCLENYLLYHVHHKIFPVIIKHCLEEDNVLMQNIIVLSDAKVTPMQLGVREPFCCEMPNSVRELSSLNSRNSPLEKLHCLMATLELLNQDVQHFLSETYAPVNRNKDLPHITSDDLIPLLVGVIIQAKPKYLVGSLYCIQNFCWSFSSVDQFSYGLVTFQAAKEFLKNTDCDDYQVSSRKVEKELSIKEQEDGLFKTQTKPTLSEGKVAVHSLSPIDHQLENVAKMIEASTKGLTEFCQAQDNKSAKRSNGIKKIVQTQEDTLGDLLSSLRQNSLGLSYGKLS